MKKHALADEQLVSAFQTTSSAQSFEALYNRYINKVYRTCLSFTNDAQAAQDYTQDIFLKVFDKLGSFQRQSSFSTWLYAISHNHCLDQHRLSKRLPTEPLSAEVVQTLADSLPCSHDPNQDQLQNIECLLAKLPQSDRRLLGLKYEQGLSVMALCNHYQLSESAVKMRLKRSRDRLRKLYVSQGGE
ncbi:RNA polymerase sigma factor [Spirosoma agri]|uniref:Sigma-70 family RNA polymerase sigma factor n=1 Tax=Spirosoma agri TaxID=1987381 RepID=A0A6M0IS57_9BACT|nr:sigma-70 family RNA polymerase sigma factor [Spirosoma agri]NEU70807.1 sigma-70 family RNA polymerase sigma factor [Spirosoma agri]